MADVAVIFVVEPDHQLEWQCVPLACSLRARFADTVAIYAYVSTAACKPPLPAIVSALEGLNVRLVELPDELFFNGAYPHGNKILAANMLRREAHTIFFDTDMFVVQRFPVGQLVSNAVGVTVAGAATWGSEAKWRYVYESCGLTMPSDRLELASGELSPPYFNAGLVSAPTRSPLWTHWLHVAQTLDHDPSEVVADRRPWLDQITLPLAAQLAGLNYRVLDKSYNQAPSTRPEDFERANFGIRILHYHGMGRIYRSGFHRAMSQTLCTHSPFANLKSLFDFWRAERVSAARPSARHAIGAG